LEDFVKVDATPSDRLFVSSKYFAHLGFAFYERFHIQRLLWPVCGLYRKDRRKWPIEGERVMTVTKQKKEGRLAF
jgi:hypothetical protein